MLCLETALKPKSPDSNSRTHFGSCKNGLEYFYFLKIESFPKSFPKIISHITKINLSEILILSPMYQTRLGKEYVKAVYCHTAYLTYMQSTSCETPGWMKHKLESRFLGEISITSDIQMTPPLRQKEKRS